MFRVFLSFSLAFNAEHVTAIIESAVPSKSTEQGFFAHPERVQRGRKKSPTRLSKLQARRSRAISTSRLSV